MSIISCVALFCKAGKGGKDFSRKEKFRVECPKNEDGTEIKLKDLKELICQFGGICTVARDVGLGEELDLRIGRLDSRCDRYSMNTDAQVRLEMPRIREGIDKLQGMQNEFALFCFHAPLIWEISFLGFFNPYWSDLSKQLQRD